ncbi:MAG: hypothetical protein WCX32_03540 [Clostridia bacterium]|jgi:cell division protein FtsL|nr:hypothetical protein [Clostridia bacterium]MDD4275611.1 hypothetical protein [Clostridia bacterium]
MIPTKYNLSDTTVITKENEKIIGNNQTNDSEHTKFDNNYSAISLQDIFDKYSMHSNSTVEEVEQEKKSQRDYTTLMQVNEVLPEQQNKNEERIDQQKDIFIKNKNIQPALNFRGKLLIAVYSLVMILMGALMINNAVIINSVSADIQSLSSSITEEEISISDIKRVYDTLNKADNLTERAYHADMTPVENSVLINLLPVANNISTQLQTNWFDSVCNYLSGLFGGK